MQFKHHFEKIQGIDIYGMEFKWGKYQTPSTKSQKAEVFWESLRLFY